MNETLERLWVSFLNSDQFRQFAKQGIGSVLFQSRAKKSLHLAGRYLTTYYKSRQEPSRFQDVKTFCIFVGHTKSGSSLLGGLLDAHPNTLLADETDALQYISAGFGRDQIFHLLFHASRREVMRGRVTARRLTPYSFLVPGQWQGRYSTLHVIGDSTSGSATERFAGDPALVQRLQNVMGKVNVKFIHVIRNPYDPIGVMMVRGKRTFENAVEHYFTNCQRLVELRKQLGSSNLRAVKYEEFVRQPEANLVNICHFLGLEASDDYLQACTNILHKTPDQNRQMVEWDSRRIAVVKKQIDQFDFLAGYSFEQQEPA